jgi:tetratricopeptide (TPR) repeat protein
MKRISDLLWILFLLSLAAFPQSSDRPREAADAERNARELFQSGDYAHAIPILEKATADYPSDLKNLSLLGMAYLYSSSRMDLTANVQKALEANTKVVELGGEAVFLVGRGDDPMKSMSPHVVKTIQGELKVRKESFSFTPSRTSTGAAGPFSGGEVRECGLNKSYGRDSNTFHIKTTKETINFRPLHFSQDESEMVCSLLAKFLGTKTADH